MQLIINIHINSFIELLDMENTTYSLAEQQQQQEIIVKDTFFSLY
jgi:hypothetical protein